jgi:hypothetical protein
MELFLIGKENMGKFEEFFIFSIYRVLDRF